MFRSASTVVFSFTALLACLPAQAPTSARAALEDVLPQTSYLCAQFAGLEACAQAADTLDVARLVQAFLDGVPEETKERMIDRHLDRVADQVRQHLEGVGLAPSVIRSVLGRPMVLGMGRVTLRGMGPSVALVIDEGGAARDVDALVGVLLELVQRHDKGFSVGQGEAAGVPCRTLEHEAGPTIYFARAQGLFVVTNSPGYLGDILATASGRAHTSLAAGSSLGGQRARLGGQSLATMFVNTGSLTTILDEHLPYEAAELGAAFGIADLAGLFAGVACDHGATVATVDVALTGAASGLFKAAFSGEADLAAARLCSDETVAFASMRLDAAQVIPAWSRLMAVLPEAVAAEIQRNLSREMGRGMRRAGMQPAQVEQLLNGLEGSVSIAANLPSGGLPIPEVLAFVKLRDRAVVAPWIERLAGMVAEQGHLEWKTRDVDGQQVRYCEIDVGGVTVTPTFALTDQYLILGSQTRAVTAALARRAAESLFATEDFAHVVHGEAGACGLLHLRLLRAAELGWRPFESMVTALMDQNAEQLGFDGSALPEQEAFVRGLGTLTMSLGVDDAGIRCRTRGALGVGGLLVAGCKLLDEVLARASSKLY